MLEGVVTSDWHIDAMRKHFPDYLDRVFAELNKICQYAIKNGIRHVFIPGDISDTPSLAYDDYIALVLFLKKYDGLLNFHYIAGNHDFSDVDKTSLDLLGVLCDNKFFKTVTLYLQPARVVIDDVPVNFLPFPCLKTLSTKQGAVNFAHVEYSGAIGDNGRTLKTKHELETHPNDFTVSGHIHQYQYMEKKRAVYCGNPFQKNFGEKLPKGFIHFKARMQGNKVEFKHKFVDNRPSFILQNVDIETNADFSKLKSDANIRYKIRLAPDVVPPSDILLQYPNITGGIFAQATGKKVSGELDDLSELIIPRSTINIQTGLKRHLIAEGYDAQKIKVARQLVKEARNQLGV